MNLENEKWPVVFKGKESIIFFICTFTITNGHKSVFLTNKPNLNVLVVTKKCKHDRKTSLKVSWHNQKIKCFHFYQTSRRVAAHMCLHRVVNVKQCPLNFSGRWKTKWKLVLDIIINHIGPPEQWRWTKPAFHNWTGSTVHFHWSAQVNLSKVI